MKPMKKPYVICHMMTAVDGRIDCAMTEQLPGVQEYYSTLDSLAAPSRVSGRVTAQLEMASPGIFEPQDAALGHESFSRNADADGYEIVIDTRGTLLWDELDASERVSRDYIAYLDGLHISWIACGKERVDLARACEILASAFGVERMAVVGGGHIHTAFLAEVKHWHGAKADSWFSHIAVSSPMASLPRWTRSATRALTPVPQGERSVCSPSKMMQLRPE